MRPPQSVIFIQPSGRENFPTPTPTVQARDREQKRLSPFPFITSASQKKGHHHHHLFFPSNISLVSSSLRKKGKSPWLISCHFFLSP